MKQYLPLLLLLIGCNAVKNVKKSQFKTQQVVEHYLKTHPFKNDTITNVIPGDTITEIEVDTLIEPFFQTDSFYRDRYHTITKTITKRRVDTLVKTVRDNSFVQELQRSNAFKEGQVQQAKEDVSEMKSARNKWRLWFWLLAAAFVAYKVIKSRLKLLLPLLFLTFGLQAQISKHQTTVYSGKVRTIGYLKYIPNDYLTKKHPVIVVLHGFNERGFNGTTGTDITTLRPIYNVILPKVDPKNAINFKGLSNIVYAPQLSTEYKTWQKWMGEEMFRIILSDPQTDRGKIYVGAPALIGGFRWLQYEPIGKYICELAD